MIYGILGVSCDHDYNYGNTNVYIDQNTGNIKLTRKMNLLGFDGIELNQVNTASIEDHVLDSLRPFIRQNSPYLQISNLNDQSLKVEVFSMLGQPLYKTNRFTNTSLNVSNYNEGLYLIKITTANNQQSVFKQLLN